jgi:hypothetical protein
MMEHAINNKLDIYSFGRSTNGSGTHRFKKQWGSFDKQLFWNFSLPKKVNIRKMRLASEVWKRLPYLITDWLGPVIAGRVY